MRPEDVVPSMFTAARGFLAAVGLIGIIALGVVPVLAAVGEFLFIDIPNWRLQWRQQAELRELQQRLAAHKKRRVRALTKEAQRHYEEHQEEETRRQRALERRREAEERVSAQANDKESKRKHEHEKVGAKPRQEKAEQRKSEKPSVPVRRTSRPLQALSPNVPVDQRPVATYAKVSAGVTKPAAEKTRSFHAPTAKSRVLSLGSIFEDSNDENVAPVSRMWAH